MNKGAFLLNCYTIGYSKHLLSMWTHFCVQFCEIFGKLVPNASLTDEVMNYVLENLTGPISEMIRN